MFIYAIQNADGTVFTTEDLAKANEAVAKGGKILAAKFEAAAAIPAPATLAPAAQPVQPAQASSATSNVPALHVTVNTGEKAVEKKVEPENKLRFLDPKQLKPETLLIMTAGGQHVDFHEAVANAPAVQAKLGKTEALLAIAALEIGRVLISDRNNVTVHAPMPAM